MGCFVLATNGETAKTQVVADISKQDFYRPAL